MTLPCFVGVCVLLFGPLVAGATNCGVTLVATSAGKNLTTSGYPQNYFPRQSCTWNITTEQQNQTIQLYTTMSLLEDASSLGKCDTDYVTVYNGLNSYVELGTFCGHERPVLASGGNSLRVHLHTGSSHTYRLLKMFYKAIPATTCNVTLPAGQSPLQIVSPGYPNNYQSGLDCQWTIEAASGRNIKVKVLSVDMENVALCAEDFLLFNDGTTNHARQLAKICATTVSVIASSNNHMTITFHSDSSSTGGSFRLQYSSDPTCGPSDLSASSAIWVDLSSPRYPSNYNNNVDCQWTISGPLGYKIEVDIVYFYMKYTPRCTRDYLLFSDGSSSYAAQLGKYCGTYVPTEVISSGRYMTITFHTDSYDTGRRFHLKYKAGTSLTTTTETTPVAHCGSSRLTAYTSAWRYLSSPGYPNNYNNNMHCQWTISATVGYVIKVEIIALSMEYHRSCANDYLLLNDGTSVFAPQLGKYCGRGSITGEVVSSSNGMFITFFADSSITGEGFNLKFRAGTFLPTPTEPTTVLICGPPLLSASTSSWRYLSSPGYPYNDYSNNMRCKWTISALDGYVIKVEIIALSMEYHSSCANDYLLLSDGPSSYGAQLGKYCGHTTEDVVSSFNIMNITFHTDGSITDRGFSLKYMATTPGSGTGEQIGESETKYIQSPNYPLNYPNNANSEWTFSTDVDGYVIHVKVVLFYLENDSTCSFDYVQLYDVTGTYEHSLGRWCGSEGPDTQSTGTSMKVRFHSDGSSTSTGFKLAFTAGEPTSPASSKLNVGGIIGGVFGGFVGVTIALCCCCGMYRKKSKTNNQLQSNRSPEAIGNTVYSVPLPNYPASVPSAPPAMFTSPPTYSEVVKDDPPPYCHAVPLSDIQPVVTSSPSGASSYEGIDNPAGPS